MDGELPGGRARPLGYWIAAYGALVLAIALATVIAGLWHSGLLNLYLVLRLNRWAFELYGFAVTVVLGLTWVILALVLENRFSRAGDAATLRRRVSRVLVVEAALLAVSAGAYWLLLPHRPV